MTQQPAPDWPARMALTVAREVRRHRQAQGLSAQQLSDRCAALGMPIQRSVLANLESGRRTTINVAELLVLAHALDVPPGVLVFPAGYEMQAEVLPGAFMESGFAVEWLAGRAFITETSAERFFDTPLGLVRLHQDNVTSLRRTVRSRDHARQEFAEVAARVGDAEEQYERLLEAQRAVLHQQSQLTQAEGRLDYERYRQLQEEYDRLGREVESLQPRARQATYARHRVSGLEQSVERLEAVVRKLRDRMKNEGLQPPLLPRVLAYLDPESPAIEDIPEKRVGLPQVEHAWTGTDDLEVTPAPDDSEEEVAPLISSEQRDEARGVLEEMKPYLTEIMTTALEEAMRRRRDRGDD